MPLPEGSGIVAAGEYSTKLETIFDRKNAPEKPKKKLARIPLYIAHIREGKGMNPLEAATSKGLEKLLDLALGKTWRRHEYKNILMNAQAAKDAELIASGKMRFDGNELIPTLPIPEDIPLQQVPWLLKKQQEEHNLFESLRAAAQALAAVPDEQISAQPVDLDWFFRWRRETEIITQPDLRTLWGRILAKEVKEPQSISLRTLDIVKNITFSEAARFCKACMFAVENVLVCRKKQYPSAYDLEDILDFVDAGLVISSENIIFSKDLNYNQLYWNDGAGYCLVFELQHSEEVYIPGVPLSRAGIELLQIAEMPAPSGRQVKELVQLIGNHGRNLTNHLAITVHPLLPSGDKDEETILYKWRS